MAATEDVLRRVRVLLRVTVENGATEAEALAAATKATSLLDQYGLTLSEEETAETEITKGEVEVGKVRRHPVHWLLHAVTIFTETKAWFMARRHPDPKQSKVVARFLGFPGDVEVAVYLFAYLRREMDRAWEEYKARATWITNRSDHHSFMMGMVLRLEERLLQMAYDRQRAFGQAGGTALVPVKDGAIQAAFDALGVELRDPPCGPMQPRDQYAQLQGERAGAAVPILPALDAAAGSGEAPRLTG